MQAALHAHEFAGMVALDRLIPRLEQAESEGRLASSVTLVPHANPVGLAQAVFGETLGRFDVNSRLNFNRSFPADAPESLSGRSTAERLKATLLSLAAKADVVLDLHCDDEGPVYLYTAERQLDEGRRLARALGATVILTMMDVTPDLAKRDAAGLYRYLVDLGAVSDPLDAYDPADPVVGDVDDAQLIPTPVPGALLYDVSVGDWVTEGQRLATVLSEVGVEPYEVRSPFDGLVMTRRDRRFVRRGEDVIKVLRHPRSGSRV
jgi:predicted deacylase